MAHNGWFFLAHLVEGGYRLLTPDRPGYLGTLLANNGSPEAQADLAAALLDALAIDTVAVVGNSAGDQVLCNLCYVTRIEQKLSFFDLKFSSKVGQASLDPYNVRYTQCKKDKMRRNACF